MTTLRLTEAADDRESKHREHDVITAGGRGLARRGVLLAAVILSWSSTTWAATETAWADPSLPTHARGLEVGDELRIAGVPINPGGPTEILDLERFRVFSPDARVVIHGETGIVMRPPPANAFFVGRVVE